MDGAGSAAAVVVPVVQQPVEAFELVRAQLVAACASAAKTQHGACLRHSCALRCVVWCAVRRAPLNAGDSLSFSKCSAGGFFWLPRDTMGGDAAERQLYARQRIGEQYRGRQSLSFSKGSSGGLSRCARRALSRAKRARGSTG